MSARANVVKYLKARQGVSGIDQEQIHGFHAGDEEREAKLLESDLWALTRESRRLEAAQRLADALRYWLPDESMAPNEYTHEWNKAAAALAEWEATK